MAANLTNKYADSTVLQWRLCNEHNESSLQQKIQRKNNTYTTKQTLGILIFKSDYIYFRKDKIQR